MIKPKQNFLITGFFRIYIDRIISCYFFKVEYNRPEFDAGKSVLLVANHCSWWDGFLLYQLCRVYFNKKFHVMILEETMHKVGFFKYLGGFSVAKNTREMIASLDYAAGLLQDPENLVVIFPQGKLYSNFVDDVDFGKGAVHIAKKAKTNFQYVLATMFSENFERKKPTVNIYLKVLNVNDIAPDDLPGQYQAHYKNAKQQQTSIVI